eukprot:8674429-Alexandrium_andersonii.AAC.1
MDKRPSGVFLQPDGAPQPLSFEREAVARLQREDEDFRDYVTYFEALQRLGETGEDGSEKAIFVS